MLTRRASTLRVGTVVVCSAGEVEGPDRTVAGGCASKDAALDEDRSNNTAKKAG